MDLKVEEIDDVKRKLKIEIPVEVVSKRIEKAYKELNQQIKMPGFRPGKIPQKVLEKQVPVASMTQVLQDLLQEYYEKALDETGITPAGPPEIDHSDIHEVKKDAPLAFSVVLDIKPKIEFKDYKGLKFKKKEFSVKDSEVDEALKKHLEPLGEFQTMEDGYKVAKGDFVVMDFDGVLNGEPLEDGRARGYETRIGDGKMIAGFEDQVVGHAIGEEFEVRVNLPHDWNKKMRRVSMPIPGKTGETPPDLACFKVKLKEVKQLKLPELTEEFVRSQGEDSVESLRRKVKGELQMYKDHGEEIRIKQDIFDYLVKNHEMEAPESLVKQELKFMIDGMRFQIQNSGMKLEDSGFEPERAEKEWRPKAEYNAKGYAILEGIANVENIHASQSDLEDEYNRLAHETGKPVEKVKEKLFANQEAMHQTTQRIRGQKALNFIYSHCEFEFEKSAVGS